MFGSKQGVWEGWGERDGGGEWPFELFLSGFLSSLRALIQQVTAQLVGLGAASEATSIATQYGLPLPS